VPFDMSPQIPLTGSNSRSVLNSQLPSLSAKRRLGFVFGTQSGTLGRERCVQKESDYTRAPSLSRLAYDLESLLSSILAARC